MGKISESREYPALTADDCFHLAVTAITQAGFEIFKKRDFAWLVIGKRSTTQGQVEANITARPGKAPSVTFSLSSDMLNDQELENQTNVLIGIFENLNK